jgi:NADPH-dependent curcumin reductase CurA
VKNRQLVLASRPSGMPDESNFRLVESDSPSPASGEVLVRTLYLSVDPYMRGRMSEAESYAEPVQIGQVMVGSVVGQVEKSNSPRYSEGDIVESPSGWQEYAAVPASGLRKIDPSLAPISTALGVLGMPGMTAYFGLLEIGKPAAGETVVVSGAAGAVGSLVGQIARIRECRAVGIAGSDEKVDYVTRQLGFDCGFNYKDTEDYTAALRTCCPKGIDVYFDNVGGPISDAAMRLINTGARVVVCGQISQYNHEGPDTGPRWFWRLIVRQARVEGFLVFQFADRFAEGLEQMAEWLRDGKLQYREDVVEGIENAPRAFIGMLQGRNTGKQLVKVAAV